MAVTIKKINTQAELKSFILFNHELYKGHPYAVPDFYEDLLDTFNPKKNAALEFCEADYFLAYNENGKIVGRVAAIINHKANTTWNVKQARFGWIDFIDDEEVSKALMNTVEDWGREHGMERIVGPLGFTDLDPEGMLIDGYDQLSTMSTIYNYPYYPKHIEAAGYEKEIDWVERKIYIPSEENKAGSDKYFKVADISAKRYNLHIRKFKNVKELKKDNYIHRIFDVVNTAYAPLFGYSKMNEQQINQYVYNYLPFVDLRLLSVVENEDNQPIAMGVAMTSISKALQKAKGKLFPFGWFHLAKTVFWKRSDIIDLLLVAVLPEYQSKGVHAIIFADMIPIAQKMGFRYAESHPQLETNEKAQNLWAYLNTEIHKQRRCYTKKLK